MKGVLTQTGSGNRAVEIIKILPQGREEKREKFKWIIESTKEQKTRSA